MALKVPRSIYHLLSVMSRQEPQSRFQNEGKRSRGCIKNRQQQMQVRLQKEGALNGGVHCVASLVWTNCEDIWHTQWVPLLVVQCACIWLVRPLQYLTQ